jgi:hypothetical protein
LSPAFYLQDQQQIPFPNGVKLILDGRPLYCSLGDSAPFPLQIYCQISLGEGFRDELKSDRKRNMHLLA